MAPASGKPLTLGGRDLDRDRRARAERLEGGREAAVGEDGRRDPTGEVAKLGDRRTSFLPRGADQLTVLGTVAEPLLGALDPWTITLIGAGGILYSTGTVFHLWTALPGQNAIWHGFVLAAVAFHYAAVMLLVLGVGVSG